MRYAGAMCNQYIPPEPRHIRTWFESFEPTFSYKARVFKGYDAPILVRPGEGEDGSMPMAVRRARFGLVPFFSKSLDIKYDTMNARSETAATTASFRGPWKRRQLCIIPIQAFIEPYYGDQPKSQWWGIERADREPLAAAGLYDTWRPAQDAEPVYSFTMLTINADEHPLMSRFHKPGKEKRSIVLLPREDLVAWLTVGNDDAELRGHLRLFDPKGFTAGPLPQVPKTATVPARDGPSLFDE